MTSAARALLAGAIDYAGLFPPAALSMAEAVANHASYAAGPDAWALGRFVVPAARLDEYREAGAPYAAGGARWTTSALLDDVERDAVAVAAFNAHPGVPTVDMVEFRAADESALAAASQLPAGVVAYAELPVDGEVAALVRQAGALGLRAKVRTGGVTAEAFPAAAALAGFVLACTRAGVPFKATAGLHHAVRGRYALTYAPESPRAPMYGFLNLLVASAIARAGGGPGEVEAALLADAAEEFDVGEAAVVWRGVRLCAADLRVLRGGAMTSFGSCSFTEPLAELTALPATAAR